jgi:zinc transport system ATP-binding protein
MSPEPILSVSDLGVRFDDFVALRHIGFEVHRGELIALVGPNGSGKSVLLRALLDLVPYTGDIVWGDNIRIGYVPQTLGIDRDLPMTGLEFFAVKRVSRRHAFELAKSVGMQPATLRQQLGHLSTGQLQRLLIAWALANDPDVLLFDEPTSGVDVSGQESVYDLLDRLRKERKLAVLLVSHDLNVVFAHADHVLCVSKDLVCHGPPKQALDAATLERLYGAPIGLYAHHNRHGH